MLKNKFVNRWDKLSKECIRVVCPSGDGKLPQIKYIKEPGSGRIHKEVVGYTNIQERMNKEAKEVNLIALLKEVDEGKRDRVNGISNASVYAQNSYETRKSIEKFINYWDKNPLLRLVYPNKEALLKDIQNNVNVYDKVKNYADTSMKEVKNKDDEVKKPIVETSPELRKI